MVDLLGRPRMRGLPLAKPQVEGLASTLKVLADPTRLGILALLREGELCVCELVDVLRMPQNLVSHHLGVLRQAGLVRDRRDHRDGRWIYYAIEKSALAELDGWCRELFDAGTVKDTTAECAEDDSADQAGL